MARRNDTHRSQKFRDISGQRERTLQFDIAHTPDGIHQASTDPALEAAMRPFLAELTIPQRDAIRALYWEQLSERQAADRLGISRPSLQDRLYGDGRRSVGALAKLRKALTEAAGTEDYADIRRWLTPSVTITKEGTVDPWVDARCLVCYRPLAKWRPNALYTTDEPRLICAVHMN